MSTELLEQEIQTETKQKKRRGTWLLILLLIILILFLLSTIVLGSRLYDMATRDQYTVDLGMGEPEGEIELFRIEYSSVTRSTPIACHCQGCSLQPSRYDT